MSGWSLATSHDAAMHGLVSRIGGDDRNLGGEVGIWSSEATDLPKLVKLHMHKSSSRYYLDDRT